MGKRGEHEERVATLLGQSKQTSQEISALRADVGRLKTLLNAMWLLVRDRLDLTDEQLVTLHKSLMEAERMPGRKSEPCPHCGRPLQERSAVCIYCGQAVERCKPF